MTSLHDPTDGPSGWLLDYADWQDVTCTGMAPSCRALLANPFNVLTNKARWPNHVCGDVLTASLVRWSIRRIIAQRLVDLPQARRWMDYAFEHETIPIDSGTILGRVWWQGRHDLEHYVSAGAGDERFASLMSVFDELVGNRTYDRIVAEKFDSLTGRDAEMSAWLRTLDRSDRLDEPETMEEAALIVDGECGDTEWTLYFMAMATNCSEDMDDEDDDLADSKVNGMDWRPPYEFASFAPSRVLMSVAGDPTADGVIRMYRRATEWWTKAMAGFEIRRPGRPEVVIHPALIGAAYWRMRDELEGTPDDHDPTQEDVCDRLRSVGVRISSKTLRKRLRRTGTPWPPPRPADDPTGTVV